MSFDGQVLCQRMLIGPCALTTLGAATAAPVAPAASKNLRRLDVRVVSIDMGLDPPSCLGGVFEPLSVINRRLPLVFQRQCHSLDISHAIYKPRFVATSPQFVRAARN